MKILLLSIPFVSSVLGILIYRFQDGKRQVFHLDLVQFFYLFILSPTLFIWAKSFLFFLLRDELELGLSVAELFMVDTFFSVLSFFLFISVAFHTLTKTFRIKRDHDPHFDVYHLSEYFHLWWSHLSMWAGGIVLASFFSILNLFFPSLTSGSKLQFYLELGLAFVTGIVAFFAVWMSDPKQGNFMRLMKIIFGIFFLIHVILYFAFDPKFNLSQAVYWFVFVVLLAAVICSSFFERYERTNKIRDFFLYNGWGNNMNIFEKKLK